MRRQTVNGKRIYEIRKQTYNLCQIMVMLRFRSRVHIMYSTLFLILYFFFSSFHILFGSKRYYHFFFSLFSYFAVFLEKLLLLLSSASASSSRFYECVMFFNGKRNECCSCRKRDRRSIKRV